MPSIVVPTFALLMAGAISPSEAISQAPSVAAAPAIKSDVPPEPPEKAAEVVKAVQDFYDSTKNYQATFEQKYTVKAHNLEKVSKGKVTFARPGKMNWVYDEPVGNRVVADGKVVKVYEAANQQMYETKMDSSQYPAALSFLTGQGKLSDTFTFELYSGDKGKWNFQGGWILVGTPKSPNPAYTKVLFYVDQATAQVRRVMIVDAQGNKNRFDFSNPQRNPTISEADFQFTPPANTKIIKP